MIEQRRNVGGNREEACTTLGGLICVGCSFSDVCDGWTHCHIAQCVMDPEITQL